MMDNWTTLVAFARLWGSYEGRIFMGGNINSTMMQSYDDMDLTKLLSEWATEFCRKPIEGDPNAVEKFFITKLKELSEEHAQRVEDEVMSLAILVERDYKGEYERFALTQKEFRQKFPDTYERFGPVVHADSDTLQPMVHIWFQPCTINDDEWVSFFSNMEKGLPLSDIENGNLATIRLDLFGELKEHITPYTYVRANEHTGASEEHLLLEWWKAVKKEACKKC